MPPSPRPSPSEVKVLAPPRAFWTRQIHDPAGFVRTHGGLVEGRGLDPGDVLPPPAPAGCARDKLVAITGPARAMRAACHQAGDGGRGALRVACSNGAAAAAARIAELLDSPDPRFSLVLPGDRELAVEARVAGRPSDPEGARVRQTWRGVAVDLRPGDLGDGRRYAVCPGPLNDYLLVEVRDDEDPAAFTVAQAMALAAAFGLDAEPLRCRVAVLRAGAGGPEAKFFTCGEREHPSAPLTGLVLVALLGRRLGWKGFEGAAGLRTGAALLPLPLVAGGADGTVDVAFADLVVHLDPPREDGP
ncbi:MAG: hypothetical protein U0P81_10885 [Holophagaceae bacterium]